MGLLHVIVSSFIFVLVHSDRAHIAPLRAASNAVPDEYMIWLNTSALDVRTKFGQIKTWLEGRANLKILNEYDMSGLLGFAIRSTYDHVLTLRSMSEIALVEENLVADFTQSFTDPFPTFSKSTSQSCASQTLVDDYQWGLGRINTLNTLGANYRGTTYEYHADAGDCVKCYVFDTGVRITHTDFGGRAVNGFDAIPDSVQVTANFADENGHGTHVAGTVGSATYGVAKKVQIVNVKVLDDDATNEYRGSFSDILAAIQWVISDHNNRKLTNGARVKSVINMSLSGSISTGTPEMSWETALKNAMTAGISVVVAAGNANTDACTRTPARLGGGNSNVITVAASHWDDTLASFSNYGTCVTMIAPGRFIRSTYYDSDTATAILSGTSMSAPHVAGAIARQMSYTQDAPSPAAMKAWLTSTATDKVDTSSQPTTPDLLLHVACTDGVDVWVCNDPHVSLNVKGSDRPVCFDWKGHPGRIYQLIKDRDSGVVVNARLLPQSGRKNETYVDAVSIMVDKQWIYVGRNLIVIPGRVRNRWTPNSIRFRASAGEVTVENNQQELTFTLGSHMKFSITRRYHAEHQDHFNFHILTMASGKKSASGILGDPATREVKLETSKENKERAVLTYDDTSVKVKLKWRNMQLCWLLPRHGEGFFRGRVGDYQVDCMFCKHTQWQKVQMQQVQ